MYGNKHRRRWGFAKLDISLIPEFCRCALLASVAEDTPQSPSQKQGLTKSAETSTLNTSIREEE